MRKASDSNKIQREAKQRFYLFKVKIAIHSNNDESIFSVIKTETTVKLDFIQQSKMNLLSSVITL